MAERQHDTPDTLAAVFDDIKTAHEHGITREAQDFLIARLVSVCDRQMSQELRGVDSTVREAGMAERLGPDLQYLREKLAVMRQRFVADYPYAAHVVGKD